MNKYLYYDKGINFYTDRLEIAAKYGFEYVSEMVETLYTGGLVAEKIGEILEYTAVGIYSLLEKMGIARRPKGKPNEGKIAFMPKADIDFICTSEIKVKELCVMFGLSQTSISKIRRKYRINKHG